MALKRRPPTGATKGGKMASGAGHTIISERAVSSGTFTVTHDSSPAQVSPLETIEARLERKASEADGKVFATKSLGQMSREERHRLLYGD